MPGSIWGADLNEGVVEIHIDGGFVEAKVGAGRVVVIDEKRFAQIVNALILAETVLFEPSQRVLAKSADVMARNAVHAALASAREP